MIHLILTVDYEIYGNGTGTLSDLMLNPARELKNICDQFDAKLVLFAEAAELRQINLHRTDHDIDEVKQQIKDFYRDGHEIALHLHPQWCRAEYIGGRWALNYGEYNLCSLTHRRITQIIDESILFLRKVLDYPAFTPIAFRAGNWLFQPSAVAASALSSRGIVIDSSVFKGGLNRELGLDYRTAASNSYYWRFSADVNAEADDGIMIELPIYTVMVPSWKMLTNKRVALQKRATPVPAGEASIFTMKRYMDYVRLKHPLKLDFCRMTRNEMATVLDTIISDDRADPASLKPVVAIGHTKDLFDYDAVKYFLSYAMSNGIEISTFEEIYEKALKEEISDRSDAGRTGRHISAVFSEAAPFNREKPQPHAPRTGPLA